MHHITSNQITSRHIIATLLGNHVMHMTYTTSRRITADAVILTQPHSGTLQYRHGSSEGEGSIAVETVAV